MPAEYNPDPSAGAIPPEEVARYLYEAGFRGEALLKMVAIGWRESSWRPTAHRSDRPKSELSGDLGLFQVNYTWFRNADGTLKQDFLNAIGATSPADLFKPNIAARAAWLISRGGTSFGAWSVSSEPGVGWSADGDPMNGIPSRIFEQARAAIAAAGLGEQIAGVSIQPPTQTRPAQVSSPTTGFEAPELLLPEWLDIPTFEEALRGPRTSGPETTPRAADGVMGNPNADLATIAQEIYRTNVMPQISPTGPGAATTPTAAAPANQVPTSQYALEEIAQFLNDDAAQYLLDPESMDRGSLPFKREVRLVLDKLRNDPNNISSQELLQLRYVAEGGRSVVERDIRPIVNSVQDGSYQPPAPQVTPQRPPASTVPTTTVPAPTTTQPSPTTTQPAPTTTQPAPTTTQPPSTTTTTVPGIREEFIFSGSTGQSTIIDGGMPIPDSAKQLLRQILQPKYVLYIDGANPSTVTQDERNLLNNILRNFQYVDFTDPRFLAMLQLPDPNDSARSTLQMIENERAGVLGQQPSQIVLPDISTLPQLPGEIPEGGIQPGETPAGFDPYERLAQQPSTPSPFVAAPATTGTGETTTPSDGPPTDRVYDGLEPVVTDDPFSEIYGYWWAIVNEEPELMKLIETAKAEKWGALEFQYELEQTTWWKTNSSYARQFDVEMSRDPATTQARIDTVAEQIRQLALDRNLRLSSASLNEIARNAVRFGWSQQQTLNILGTEALKSEDGVTALRYGFYGNKINEIAADYGVTISDTEFSQLVNKFAVGKENEESLTASFQTKATALFPAIADRLMAGETFSDIVDPYRERASNILERDFDVTDFAQNDNLAQAVTFVGDDGKQRPMTYTEWGNYLRSNRDFGYEYTDEAVGRAYQVANRIADLFGAI